MIQSLRKQVILGLILALLGIGSMLTFPTQARAENNNDQPAENHCWTDCCLKISGWCVLTCTRCDSDFSR